MSAGHPGGADTGTTRPGERVPDAGAQPDTSPQQPAGGPGPARPRRRNGGLTARWAALPPAAKWGVYLLLIVVAILAPQETVFGFDLGTVTSSVMAPNSDWPSILFYPIGVFVLLAVGLNIVVGQAGLLDLGYVAFFAIGGYGMAVLGTKYGWSFWEIFPVAVLISALAGLILGAPTLRLRGDYLAIVTLGFGEIIRITANNTDYLGASRGINNIPHPPDAESIGWFHRMLDSVPVIGDKLVESFTYGVIDPKPYYYIVVVLIVLTIVVVKRLERSRVGRAWVAIREDEDAAELMGVPTFQFKLWSFAIGAAIGGTAGVVFASKVISITPNNFPFMLSVLILAAVVLGGSGNLPGVMLGAFLVAWLPERFRGFENWRILVFGAALVAMMIFRPEGLLPSRRRREELAEGTGGMGSLGAEVPSSEVSSATTVEAGR